MRSDLRLRLQTRFSGKVQSQPHFDPQPGSRRGLRGIAEPYWRCLLRPLESEGCGTSLGHCLPLLRNLQHRTVNKKTLFQGGYWII
jgi:hypothetical protein